MAYQVAVELSTSPCVKAVQGDTVWGKISQDLAKALGTSPASILGVPKSDQAIQLSCL